MKSKLANGYEYILLLIKSLVEVGEKSKRGWYKGRNISRRESFFGGFYDYNTGKLKHMLLE